MPRDIIPGELHGRPSIKGPTDRDAELVAEVQAMNGEEFKKKYGKTAPNGEKNLAEYQAGLGRLKGSKQ